LEAVQKVIPIHIFSNVRTTMYGLANSKRDLDDTAWQNIYKANAKGPRVLRGLFTRSDESGDHEPVVVSKSIGKVGTQAVIE
jgi:hypothetical protein